MKRILKHPITMIVVGIFVGVMFGDKIKPMLQKLPLIGPMIK